ncbi:MAG: M48 family metallopeptidase [Acidobacteriota bacterium]|nr:M48 family metallopeptidase [Acidobacteriota bacterium]
MLRQILGFVFLLASVFAAQAAPTPSIPKAAEASARFDPVAATDAYLASVPADKHARSDAYFEGGYWLILWDFLVAAGISILLLQTRLSARMRDAARRATRIRPLQTVVYWIEYTIFTFILAFPLTVYEGFFREHQYGLANQNFVGWIGDQLKGLMVSLILGALLVTALFAIVRRLNRTWHIWGALVTTLFLIFGALIGPVFIFPLFNKFTVLNDPRITAPILSVARANGIPVTKVYEVDASRQSKRVSANVSGFLGTERITLNDNLLNRCSPPAILAVMGHEMGHYVMNHIYKMILFFAVTIVVAFALLRWSLDWSLARWGARWGLEGIGDVAVLPLAVLVFSILGFLFTPFGNTFVRTQEYEADVYGLNAARQPDGFAEAALLLGEYRKLDPGPAEECIFFDHPSGRTRIYSAMRWKKENLCLSNADLPCGAAVH